MVVSNRPRGIQAQGFFFVSPRCGKSKKPVFNGIGRPSSKRVFALLRKAHPKWWYVTDLVEFDPKGVSSFRPDVESRKNAFSTHLDDLRQEGFLRFLEKPTQNGGIKPTLWNSIPRVFFRFAPMGKVEKTRFQRNWTTFVNPAFSAAWKSPPKVVVWNRPRGIRSQACCFVSPRCGKSKTRVLNAIGRPSSKRVFSLLGKAHPKWWYETTSWNSIPRVFFRFPPMGKVEKTRFQRNWMTFVNKSFCAAWKSPPKMVVWNRPRGIQAQGCFFVSPRLGKSKTRVLNTIGWLSSTRLLALLGKANPKWWCEADLVEFDPKRVFSFRPDGESPENAFSTQLDDLRERGFYRCLQKATQNSGMQPTSWNSIQRVFFRFAPDVQSRKNAFWTQFDDLRQRRFFRCLEKPTQNGSMKPTSWNSIPRVFFRYPPMWKVEETRFERNWTTFIKKGFWPAWKSPPKMVVSNRPCRIQSQGCFFVSPRWGKSKKRVFNAIGRPSSPRLFALLGIPKPTWWYETDLVEFDPKGVFSFRPDGKSRKNAFSTQLDDLRQQGILRCLEKPTQNGGMKPTSWNSSPRVFFRFPPIAKVQKTRFKRNWTTFVNPAFSAAWKSPPKMVAWNRPRGIRSQACFFVSPRWGKSKKRVFNAIGRPSSTLLFSLLAKGHPKWWYETDLVDFDPKRVFSFRPDGKSRKNAF